MMDLQELYDKHSLIFPNQKYSKDTISSPYIQLCKDKKLEGSSFWLSGDSTEVLDYICHTKVNPKTIWNTETDPALHGRIWNFYRNNVGCNISIRPQRLHKTILDCPDNSIVYGHADFEGLIGSIHSNRTSTYTFDLIKNLKNKLADESYLAFTHYLIRRSAQKILHHQQSIYDVFINVYPQHKNKLELKNYIHHPLLLLCMYMAIILGEEYHIMPIHSIDYNSSTGYGSNSYSMNKTIVHLIKGKLNTDIMLESFLELKLNCLSVKNK